MAQSEKGCALFILREGKIKMRLDKFLKVSRLIKRRTVANEACDAGRVLINGAVAKASTIMFSGMTIFLIICTVFPNGLNLRPEVFTRDNFCIELVKRIYQTDTPTNVLPSLHVYNSICCYIAISHCEKLQHSRLIQKGSLVLSILIILSTMFLKQHSVVDVVAACVMAYFMYSLIYAQEGAKSPRLARQVI